MTWQDACNGLYELLGGLFIWLNVIRLMKDKEVKGVSLLTQAFFASWSWWNLYYYPHLSQWLSFFGGLVIGSANLLWIILALYYTKKQKQKQNSNT